jgi:hypothetical protein
VIADWAAQWPALLSAFAIVFLPGLAVGFALRLRGLVLWALAPAAGVATVSLLAIVLAAIGVPWSAGSAGIGCLVVAAIAVGAGFALGPRRSRKASSGRALLAAGLAVGIAVGLTRLVLYIGDPEAISQTNDAVFHLNALRWIAESGSASSFDLSAVTGSSVFYPGAWHAVTSLTAMVSGAQIPVAVNMVTLVTAVAVWPLGIAWLTREASRSAVATAVAAGLSASLLTFPMLMVQWGVLYPNLLSVALLPAAVAIVVAAPRWIGGESPVAGTPRAVILVAVLVLGTLGALALAQPATLLAWVVLAGSFATWWCVPRALRRRGRRRAVLLAALAAAWAGGVLLWIVFARSTTGSHWPPFRGKLWVVADVALNGQVMLPFAVAVSILMVAGLVVAVRRPELRWLATSWVLLSGLYVVAAAIGQPLLRRWLVGPWYADPYRLAALAPVTVVPLAAIGVAAAAAWIVSRAGKRSADSGSGTAPNDGVPRSAGWWALGVGAVVAIGGLIISPVVLMPKVIERQWDTESRYASQDDSWLSPDERALLEQLDELVPEDARVIGNPSTGTGFGYMLSGRDVFPRTWAHPRSSAWETISVDLREAGTDPAVCEALEAYGDAEYVLDFGEGEATPGRFILPGMTDFGGQPGFDLVAEVGDASLWRLTACR